MLEAVGHRWAIGAMENAAAFWIETIYIKHFVHFIFCQRPAAKACLSQRHVCVYVCVHMCLERRFLGMTNLAASASLLCSLA